MAPHTPRKKYGDKKRTPQKDASADRLLEDEETPKYPLASFLWCVRNQTSAWLVVPPVLLSALLFRVALGFWGYSGMFAMKPTSVGHC